MIRDISKYRSGGKNMKDMKRKRIFNELEKDLNFWDVLVLKIFKSYTYKICLITVKNEFNWQQNKNSQKL